MEHIDESHDLLSEHSEKNLVKVVIESRFSGKTIEELVRNKKYALACMRDSMLRGEAPYASHVIYAHPHFLDDFEASERAVGMHAGFIWGDLAVKTVVYADLGISSGMEMGILRAKELGREVEYRELGYVPIVSPEEIEFEKAFIENKKKLLEELKNAVHFGKKMCLAKI